MSKTDDFVSQTKGRQLMTAALDYNQEKHPGRSLTEENYTVDNVT